jgi:hypothetical protein
MIYVQKTDGSFSTRNNNNIIFILLLDYYFKFTITTQRIALCDLVRYQLTPTIDGNNKITESSKHGSGKKSKLYESAQKYFEQNNQLWQYETN